MTRQSQQAERFRLNLWRATFASLLTLLLLWSGGCVPTQGGESGRTITVYAFSVMRESLEKEIFPGFAAKWKREHNQEVRFSSSFAGSETITNQILQGVHADVAILSIERDVERLQQGKAVTSDWHKLPYDGIINKTPFVIIVRKGNPYGIHDFADLARPGVKLIHPDPVSSGGAQWSILAIYGSELIKSEKETGKRDEKRALELLQGIWRNVISTPGSAREARTQFETGYGDAIITYELEGLLLKDAGAPIEIVVPEATIFSEHPAVLIDRDMQGETRPLIEAFLDYLRSDQAQQAFVKYHFRSVTNEALNEQNQEFVRIQMPFGVDNFGGWPRAYPEIIQQVWREQAQNK